MCDLKVNLKITTLGDYLALDIWKLPFKFISLKGGSLDSISGTLIEKKVPDNKFIGVTND